jgi:hypothetical protein
MGLGTVKHPRLLHLLAIYLNMPWELSGGLTWEEMKRWTIFADRFLLWKKKRRPIPGPIEDAVILFQSNLAFYLTHGEILGGWPHWQCLLPSSEQCSKLAPRPRTVKEWQRVLEAMWEGAVFATARQIPSERGFWWWHRFKSWYFVWCRDHGILLAND